MLLATRLVANHCLGYLNGMKTVLLQSEAILIRGQSIFLSLLLC